MNAIPKFIGAALAAAATLLLSAPIALHTTAGVAFWLFCLDWFTGVSNAALQRDETTGQRLISSSVMRQKLRSKLICYIQIIGLAGAASAMAQSWTWIVAGWGAVVASEAWSIIENLRTSATAPELAPVRLLADRLASGLSTVLKTPVAPGISGTPDGASAPSPSPDKADDSTPAASPAPAADPAAAPAATPPTPQN